MALDVRNSRASPAAVDTIKVNPAVESGFCKELPNARLTVDICVNYFAFDNTYRDLPSRSWISLRNLLKIEIKYSKTPTNQTIKYTSYNQIKIRIIYL